MNRRNFLGNSALALFGFTVLPPATTYSRIWRANVKIDTEYKCIMYPGPSMYSDRAYTMLVDRKTKEMFEGMMADYYKTTYA